MFLALLATVSCKEWISPDINTNPDEQVSVPLSLILPSAEINYGYTIGGMDVIGNTSIWMNQLTGADRQALAINQYSLKSDDVNNLWNSNYSGIMEDCKKVIEQAGTSCPHFAGVAKIILAATLGHTTALWGDIPYSDAFKCMDNLKPKFDTQEQIFVTIQSLLDEAIVNLSTEKSKNLFVLKNDLIYGNNVTLWIKTAYVLKARYAMFLSKKGENAAATAVLAALASGYTSSADDASIVFDGASSASQNPLYQMIDQRSGYIAMNSTFRALLSDNSDPRVDVVANVDLGLNFYLLSNSSVSFASYTEACFLKAEALMIKTAPDNAAAADAYNKGLEASLKKLGVYGDGSWYNSHKLDATTVTRKAIIEGKYIAMVGTNEPFNDWRRTGFPVLTVNKLNTNSNRIPVRFLYPTDELNYNTINCPIGITLNTPIWAFQ